MARAASRKRPGALLGEPGEMCGERRGVERLADHAGRGEEDFLGRQPGGRGGGRARLHRLPALHAGKGVGVAGIDDERPRLARPAALPRSHSTGAEAQRDLVKTPGDRGRGIEADKKQVGPPLVANARLGGREAHAGDLRKLRKKRRRKRRDVTPHVRR